MQKALTNREGAGEQIAGTVERIVYQNPDNGWAVLKVRVKGRRRFATVVGFCAFVTPGEGVEAEGQWTENAEFGERFEATRVRTVLPRAASAAEKYLASGLVRGVGPALAKRMIARFGAGIFDVLESAPDLLRDVKGVGPTKVQSIVEAWSEQKSLKQLTGFLGSHGISVSKAPRIFRALGSEAVEILEKNPYRLAREVEGVGFKSADRIAKDLGLSDDSLERYASALHDRLQNAVARGHCALPRHELLKATAEVVSAEPADILPALEEEIEAGRLTEDRLQMLDQTWVDCIFPAGLANSERRLSEYLAALANRKPLYVQRTDSDLGSLLGSITATKPLSPSQEKAKELILQTNVCVLTGGPGTGKTTLVRSIRFSLERRGLRVRACAPTGRAAQKLSEASGLDAQTIHRMLRWDPATHDFFHRADRPLPLDYLIIDEASMVGLELMEKLIAAVPRHAGVLFVGDVDQLPSIQAGRVLDSIVESGVIAHARLSEVFRIREGHGNSIQEAAAAVLRGQYPSLERASPQQGFHFIESREPLDAQNKIVSLVKDRIPSKFGLDPIDQVQVLSPSHKGGFGARQLNRVLQDALNPSPMEQIERFGVRYGVGDKVIAIFNDYDRDVFNGDVGRVVQIERDRASLRVAFAGERRIDYEFAELDALVPAYAMTIHKSQGSEYEAVIVSLHEDARPLLNRNLLYTALTRARRLAIIVGTREAFKLSLRSAQATERRWSGLARKLVESRGEAAKFTSLSFSLDFDSMS